MILRANFAVFTVIDVKVSFIDIYHVGNAVYPKHVHAALHWIIKQKMVFKVKVSEFIEGNCNFRRLERISCLGSACKMRAFLEFP